MKSSTDVSSREMFNKNKEKQASRAETFLQNYNMFCEKALLVFRVMN